MSKLKPIYARIQNYQSIEDIDIEIKGFTCIIGKTNIGKSAIIRAISGAILNNSVVGQVRKETKYCTVKLESEDWGFTWEKGEKGINRYHLPGSDHPLDKVGQGQIEQIANMGFQSVRIGKKDHHPWLASQFEPLFLLNQSGSIVTDFISEVSRLKVLQDAILINIRQKKQATDEIKIHTKSIEELKVKKSKVDSIDSLLKVEEELDEQLKSIENYEEQIKIGKELHDDLEMSANQIKKLQDAKKTRIPVDRVENRIKELEEINEHLFACEQVAQQIIVFQPIKTMVTPEDLDDNLNDIKDTFKLSDRIEKTKQSIDVLSKELNIPDLEDDIPDLIAGYEILFQVEQSKKVEESLSGQLQKIKEDIKNTQDELDSIPSCPTCGRPLEPKHTHAAQGVLVGVSQTSSP